MINNKHMDFKKIKIVEIKNYYKTTNDVIDAIILYNECLLPAIIKIKRVKSADLVSEVANVNYLNDNLLYNKVPIIYEYGKINNKMYIVFEKIKGRNLQEILKKNKQNKNLYLEKYGAELALIHKIDIKEAVTATKRNFEKISNDVNDLKIKKYLKYLNNNKIKSDTKTFIHGDFHYGNVLWHKRSVSCVLDWEYSGLGFKEQDIAWTIAYRPKQVFMDNIDDLKVFLNGYKKINNYNEKDLKWCLINTYLHFYLTERDSIYQDRILELLEEIYDL